MLKRLIHFIKYNNATVLILVLVFVAGSGVFAQTETGQELIGTETSRVEGVDNTLLVEADLDDFDMEYRIERIESDNSYYYVYYTCLDLVDNNGAWEYQLNEKVRKVSSPYNGDLGKYLEEEFGEEYDARLKELRLEQAKAREAGQSVRTEVTEYSGLIGATLAVAERVFPGYTAVKTTVLASPDPTLSLPLQRGGDEIESSPDDLTLVYEDYIARMDPDGDDVFGEDDNCPNDYNPRQYDDDGDGIGDPCDFSFTMPEESDEDASATEETATSSVSETASSTDEADPSAGSGQAEEATSTEEYYPFEESTSTEEEVIIVDLEEAASSS